MTASPVIRPYEPGDLPALYEICLATGDFGEDASHLFKDRKMIGHVFSAPYGALCPQTCFVVEDEAGVAGYAVGTLDTRHFEDRLEKEWWPALRKEYADPGETASGSLTYDERYARTFHHPGLIPAEICEPFPAHMHMNLLPRLHRQGCGTGLFEAWREAAKALGRTHVHIGAWRENTRGVAFWTSCGFKDLTGTVNLAEGNTIWMGQEI